MKNIHLVVVVAFLFSFSIVFALEQPVNDFLWDLQIYPSDYVLVFEERIDDVTEEAALSFMDHFGMSRSRLDTDGGVPVDKVVLVGNPGTHKVIQQLGRSGSSLLEIDASNGHKLIIAATDSQQIASSIAALQNAQLSAPASRKQGAPVKIASSEPKVEQLSPSSSSGFLEGVREQYAPGMSNTVFLALLGALIVSPMLAFGVVRHSKKKKVNVQKDQLKQYLAAYVQRGYTKQHLQQYFKPQLLQRGWDDKHIDEVFETLDDGARTTLPA